VNVNHPKGSPLAPRDYQDRIGVIRQVELRGHEGLFADFHFNPKHMLAEQLVWDAQHAPENVGFSHNVLAQTSRLGEETLVERITRVQSVDLVADPATTRGLFESSGGRPASGADEPAPGDVPWRLVTLEGIQQHRPDLVSEVQAELRSEVARLQGRLDESPEGDAIESRRAEAVRLLREYELPTPDSSDAIAPSIVDEAFFESLLATPDREAMQRLVAGRAGLVRAARRMKGYDAPWRPRSRGAVVAAGDGDSLREFVAAVKSG
jgi:hypothetical protein